MTDRFTARQRRLADDADEAFKKLSAIKWKEQARRLASLRRRNLGPIASVDGYPTSTMNATPGASTRAEIDSATGETLAPVTWTSVEAAALARSGQKRDKLAELAVFADMHLQHAVDALDALERTLTAAESYTGVADPQAAACESCQREGISTVAERWTTVAKHGHEILKAPMHLCGPCAKFAWDKGRLPTELELRRHDETGRWRIRDSA